jgi:hypothetical protein
MQEGGLGFVERSSQNLRQGVFCFVSAMAFTQGTKPCNTCLSLFDLGARVAEGLMASVIQLISQKN